MKRKSLLIVLLTVALLISVRSVNAGQILGRRTAELASVQVQSSKPGTFSKISPAGGSIQAASVTLSWGISSGATSYEYCIDKVKGTSCDSKWVKVGYNQSVNVTGLKLGKTFYWTVRARNSSGKIKSDNGVWWNFKVTSSNPYPALPSPTPTSTPYP